MPIGKPIDAARAQDWVRGSLAQGSDLAMLITPRLTEMTTARLLASPQNLESLPVVLDEYGRGIRLSEADDVARHLLSSLHEVETMTLIVEDDLARRGDPELGRVAFVDERVIRWHELEEDAAEATKLLRTGASGYPLNAFVCRGGVSELKLTTQRDLTAIELEQIAASTLAVIVSVWDAEAYVALLVPKLATLVCERFGANNDLV